MFEKSDALVKAIVLCFLFAGFFFWLDRYQKSVPEKEIVYVTQPPQEVPQKLAPQSTPEEIPRQRILPPAQNAPVQQERVRPVSERVMYEPAPYKPEPIAEPTPVYIAPATPEVVPTPVQTFPAPEFVDSQAPPRIISVRPINEVAVSGFRHEGANPCAKHKSKKGKFLDILIGAAAGAGAGYGTARSRGGDKALSATIGAAAGGTAGAIGGPCIGAATGVGAGVGSGFVTGGKSRRKL